MKIEQLHPGQVVYNVVRRRMGNTTLKTTGVFSVRVVEVHPLAESVSPPYVLASWNSNTPRKYWRRDVSKWKKEKPLLIESGGFGGSRLATRAEIKVIKEHNLGNHVTEKMIADARLMQTIFPAKDHPLPVMPQLHVPLQKPVI